MLSTVSFAADLFVAVAGVAVQLVEVAVVTVVRDGVALAADFVVTVPLAEFVVVTVVLDAIAVLSVFMVALCGRLWCILVEVRSKH